MPIISDFLYSISISSFSNISILSKSNWVEHTFSKLFILGISLKNLLSQQIIVSNYSGSTRCIDSNTQRFDHQSAPITTGQIDKDMWFFLDVHLRYSRLLSRDAKLNHSMLKSWEVPLVDYETTFLCLRKINAFLCSTIVRKAKV